MRENRMKRMLKEGRIVVGVTILEWTRPSIARMMALAGFDFLFLEYEHVFVNEETMAGILLAGREEDIPVVVKVPSLERHFISRALDAGAWGIQLPRTESRKDVDGLVQYVKFPPIGDRAAAVGLANTDYEAMSAEEFFRRSNEETLVIAHIETRRGAENVDEILDNEWVDVAFVGPSDLSASLGIPGQMDNPLLLSAIERVIRAARKRGIAPGIYAGSFEQGRKWIERGMQLIEGPSDVHMLVEKGREMMKEYRSFLAAQR